MYMVRGIVLWYVSCRSIVLKMLHCCKAVTSAKSTSIHLSLGLPELISLIFRLSLLHRSLDLQRVFVGFTWIDWPFVDSVCSNIRMAQPVPALAQERLTFLKAVTGIFFFFYFPQLGLWGSSFWVRFLRMWPYLNPAIEVVTFRFRGWCMLGVFLLPAFTRLGHEHQDLLSPCDGMHVCTD